MRNEIFNSTFCLTLITLASISHIIWSCPIPIYITAQHFAGVLSINSVADPKVLLDPLSLNNQTEKETIKRRYVFGIKTNEHIRLHKLDANCQMQNLIFLSPI